MLRTYQSLLDFLITSYARLLLAVFALTPGLLIAYLHLYQVPDLLFEQHASHVVAITLAIVIGGFVSYVTWLCYRDSGEVFLRWLTLGLLGFTIVYAPHGFLTPLAHSNPWLFLLYGPASRLVMAVCFFMAMLRFGTRADSPAQRRSSHVWGMAILVFLVIDLLVALLALSPWRAEPWPRLLMEYSALGLCLLSIALMLVRRIRNSLMLIYMIALAWFAQSSLSFTIGVAWNHQWWLAHIIFAGGFLLLSYGVVQAYHSTRSFTKVYSQSELLQQVLAEKRRAEKALVGLQDANAELERLASTDPLTGAANRRELMHRVEQEVARARRSAAPISLLMADLDHFKRVNDEYSHQAGDDVLREFVRLIGEVLRPSDLLGRIGGEEFAVLLPETKLAEACQVAERIRQALEQDIIHTDEGDIRLTTSIGVAEFRPGEEDVDGWFNRADEQLYAAKQHGRNRVFPC